MTTETIEKETITLDPVNSPTEEYKEETLWKQYAEALWVSVPTLKWTVQEMMKEKTVKGKVVPGLSRDDAFNKLLETRPWGRYTPTSTESREFRRRVQAHNQRKPSRRKLKPKAGK